MKAKTPILHWQPITTRIKQAYGSFITKGNQTWFSHTPIPLNYNIKHHYTISTISHQRPLTHESTQVCYAQPTHLQGLTPITHRYISTRPTAFTLELHIHASPGCLPPPRVQPPTIRSAAIYFQTCSHLFSDLQPSIFRPAAIYFQTCSHLFSDPQPSDNFYKTRSHLIRPAAILSLYDQTHPTMTSLTTISLSTSACHYLTPL